MESASLYQQHGSGDSGASVLDKAAKILEENSPEKAVKLYQHAADVSSVSSFLNYYVVHSYRLGYSVPSKMVNVAKTAMLPMRLNRCFLGRIGQP